MLQAADSLSCLETMVPLVVSWVQTGKASRERAEGKIRSSVERIAPGQDRARELAAPYLDAALLELAAAREGAAR